jgi:hypothetical protein
LDTQRLERVSTKRISSWLLMISIWVEQKDTRKLTENKTSISYCVTKHIMEHNSMMKGGKLLICAKTWIKTKIMLPNERR